MIDLSTITEEQIVVSGDKKTAKRYRVVEEVIDLEALRQEKEVLEASLKFEKPTTEMLIQEGMGIDPYYRTDKIAV